MQASGKPIHSLLFLRRLKLFVGLLSLPVTFFASTAQANKVTGSNSGTSRTAKTPDYDQECAARLENGFREFHGLSVIRYRPKYRLDADTAEGLASQLRKTRDLQISFQMINPRTEVYVENWGNYFGFVPIFSHYQAKPEDYIDATVLVVLEKVLEELKVLIRIAEKAHRTRIKDIGFGLRLTSDLYGFAVNENTSGDSDGFHTHSDPRNPRNPRNPKNAISFTWPLKGKGSTFKGMPIGEENEIVIFGQEVPHGTPRSQTDRIIVVGSMSF